MGKWNQWQIVGKRRKGRKKGSGEEGKGKGVKVGREKVIDDDK